MRFYEEAISPTLVLGMFIIFSLKLLGALGYFDIGLCAIFFIEALIVIITLGRKADT